MKNRKEIEQSLINYIDYISDAQLEFIDNLLNLPSYPSKDDILKLAGYNKEKLNKIDSAYPIDYIRQIEEVYPGINDQVLCFDYNNKNFGELLNVGSEILKHILTIKNK